MDPAQPPIRNKITEVKQGKLSNQIANLEIPKKDEPLNAEVNRTGEDNMDHIRYGPLYKAVLGNDWKAVDDFISKDPQVLTAKIKVYVEETGIHIITRNLGVPLWLLEKIASMVTPESLRQLKNEDNWSVIFQAAVYGNTKAAKVFVHRNRDLPNIRHSSGLLPIHVAAARGQKEVLQYLLSVTKVPLDDEHGVTLLENLINAGFCGIALDLLKRYPKLARAKEDRGSILLRLANKPRAFESGLQLGFWERLIYYCTPAQEEHIPSSESVDGDIKKAVERSRKLKKFTLLGSVNFQQICTGFGSLLQKSYIIFWNALERSATRIKCIRDKKIRHMQTLEIVRIMCHEGVNWRREEARMSLAEPVITAARLGIYELVNEILKAYFFSFTYRNESKSDIFLLAMLHRHDKVFSLVNRKDILLTWHDDVKEVADMNEEAENILHLAGKFVPSKQVPGAALQMQKELQWFKAIESFVHPSRQEQRNKFDQTPREVFTKEHEELVKEGEKWMKETASSCTIVAALIITVVFAAAFTVPGGNDSTGGMPIFLHKPSFIVFVISDALALFSSTASVLPGHPHFTFRGRRFYGVLAKQVNYWPRHLVLFYCKHDGCIWCNHLHISFSSMEMDYYSNFPAWMSPSNLICLVAVSSFS